MSNKQAVIVTLVFNFILEYLVTPIAMVYPLWFVFFPTFSLVYVVLLSIWGRISLELLLKLVAGVWYAEKYSRQK